MIKSKHINLIIALTLLIAVVFTTVFMFNPQLFGIVKESAQPEYASKVFNKDNIISMDINVDEEDWNEMLENATDKEYISCDITINGTTFYSVGIRPKGNSSLSMVANDDTTDRFSFKIEFDHYVKHQSCFGLDKMTINNIYSDSTYMKEYLSYDLMNSMGISTPLYSYADVKVNGEDWGFYLAVEALEESFAYRNFGPTYGMLYKPESMEMGRNDKDDNQERRNVQPNNEGQGNAQQNNEDQENIQRENGQQPFNPQQGNFGEKMGAEGSGGGSDLKYIDDDVDSYPNIFDNSVFDSKKSDYKRVIKALKNLNDGTDLEKYIDVDEVLRYFAVNTVLVNLDSYVSNMKHNYYLYEKDGQLSILPWDYNLSFAGFQSGNASSAVNFPIDTPVSGIELSERPLIAKLLEVGEYKDKYHQYIQDILDDYFNNGKFEDTIDKLDSQISEYVENDASAFYTYEEYLKGLSALKEFGKLRAQSIEGQLNGTIPSTTDEQSENQDKLIDSSGINLSDLGSQGGMKGENRQPGNMPDMNVMKKAQDIIGSVDDSELTEEQIQQLKDLGLTEEQIEMMKNMKNSNREGGDTDRNQRPPDDRAELKTNSDTTAQNTEIIDENLWIIGISAVSLVISLIFVMTFKRKRVEQ